MNNRQKEVLQSQLNNEKKTLNDLKQIYKKALDDINNNIAALQGRTDTENLQSIIYQTDYQKALKKQVEGILDELNTKQFNSISEYLTNCYEDGFIGTMYDLQGQGIPLIFPIDQEQVVRALQTESKLSQSLYDSLGENTALLKKRISSNISRGIAQGSSYYDISKGIAAGMTGDYSKMRGGALGKAMTIARTEGHRVSTASAHDAAVKSKEAGADVVKQWDAALDRRTRPHHSQLDGQIRELDEPFEVAGRKAMYPGAFGVASEDINCRCVSLTRAKWALEDEDGTFTKWDGVNRELLELKPKNYEAFKKAYRKMVEDNNSLNDVTNRLLANAKKAEPGITKDLQKILKDTHGTIGYDVGNGKTALDFRLKGGDSLKRKITSDFTEGKDLDYIETHLYDAVRYTDLVDGEHLVDDYIKVQNHLESEGYKIVRVKNTLGNKTVAYRGLNTVVESPDGYKFELQFHTPESIDIKERVHILFEKQRLDGTPVAERLKLDQQMKEISSNLPDIKNIDAIKSFDTFQGEKAIKASLDGN